MPMEPGDSQLQAIKKKKDDIEKFKEIKTIFKFIKILNFKIKNYFKTRMINKYLTTYYNMNDIEKKWGKKVKFLNHSELSEFETAETPTLSKKFVN